MTIKATTFASGEKNNKSSLGNCWVLGPVRKNCLLFQVQGRECHTFVMISDLWRLVIQYNVQYMEIVGLNHLTIIKIISQQTLILQKGQIMRYDHSTCNSMIGFSIDTRNLWFLVSMDSVYVYQGLPIYWNIQLSNWSLDYYVMTIQYCTEQLHLAI